MGFNLVLRLFRYNSIKCSSNEMYCRPRKIFSESDPTSASYGEVKVCLSALLWAEIIFYKTSLLFPMGNGL